MPFNLKMMSEGTISSKPIEESIKLIQNDDYYYLMEMIQFDEEIYREELNYHANYCRLLLEAEKNQEPINEISGLGIAAIVGAIVALIAAFIAKIFGGSGSGSSGTSYMASATQAVNKAFEQISQTEQKHMEEIKKYSATLKNNFRQATPSSSSDPLEDRKRSLEIRKQLTDSFMISAPVYINKHFMGMDIDNRGSNGLESYMERLYNWTESSVDRFDDFLNELGDGTEFSSQELIDKVKKLENDNEEFKKKSGAAMVIDFNEKEKNSNFNRDTAFEMKKMQFKQHLALYDDLGKKLSSMIRELEQVREKYKGKYESLQRRMNKLAYRLDDKFDFTNRYRIEKNMLDYIAWKDKQKNSPLWDKDVDDWSQSKLKKKGRYDTSRWVPEKNPVYDTLTKAANDTKKSVYESLQCVTSLINTRCGIFMRQKNIYAALLRRYDLLINCSEKFIKEKEKDSDFNTINESVLTTYNDDFAALNEGYVYNLYWAYKERIKDEASLFLRDDLSRKQLISELMYLDEGLGEKIKTGFTNVIGGIKKIFQKFTEKLLGTFNATIKPYLDKYKNVILKQTWVNRNYKTRKIITGMKKVFEQSEVPYLNYQSMSAKLTDIPTFFKGGSFKQMTSDGESPTKLETVTDAATLGTYLKDWFLGPETNITASNMQDHIKDIYDFMYDVNKIIRDIKKSIDNLEQSCQKAIKDIGIDINQDPAANNNTNQSTTTTNTSEAYSYIYGKVFTEAEKEETTQAGGGATNSNGGTTSMTGQVASNMSNVQKTPDNYNSGVSKEGNRPLVETHIKVYQDTCIAVLKAKLTAVEFLRSEFMQIIRWHVQDYIGGETQQRNGESGNTDLKAKPNTESVMLNMNNQYIESSMVLAYSNEDFMYPIDL